MKKYTKTRFFTSLTIIGVLMISFYGISKLNRTTANVFADSASSGNAYNGVNSCSSSGSGTYYDDCHGVSWRKYGVDENPSIYKSQSQADDSEPFSSIAAKCKAINATEVYRLGYETFQRPFTKFDGRQGPSVLVNQTRKGTCDQSKEGCATVLDSTILSGVMNWDVVAPLFKIAAKFDNDGSDTTIYGRDWDNTSWFCYNPDWKDGSGEFHSQSSVKTKKGTRKSGENQENPNCMEIKLGKNETETEVTFIHEMRYDANVEATNAKVNEVSSHWDVTTGSPGSSYKGDFKANPGNKDKAWSKVKDEGETIKITLGADETEKTVTSKISYKPKVVQFEYKNGSYVVKGEGGSGSSSASTSGGATNSTSTSGSSSVCVKVTKDPTEEDKPDTDDHSKEFQAYFRLRSTVEAIDNGYDITDEIKGDSNYTNPPGDDNHIYVNFSTDRTTAEVKFSHWIKFDESMRNIEEARKASGIETGEDQWPEDHGFETKRQDLNGNEFKGEENKLPDPPACTKYTIKGDAKNESEVEFCARKDTDNPKQVMVEEKVTVDVSNLNEPVKVCSKISAKDTANMKITENLVEGKKWYGEYEDCPSGYSNSESDASICVNDNDATDTKDKKLIYESKTKDGQTVMLSKNWELEFLGLDGSSESSSEACAIVVRPGDPFEGTDKIDPWSNSENATGSPATTIKYAGEKSAIGWKSKARFWGARQVTEHRAIAFLVSASEVFSAEKTYGNISQSSDAQELEKSHKNGHGKDPCTWYGKTNGKFDLSNNNLETWCGTVDTATRFIRLFMPTAKAYYHTTDMSSGSLNDMSPRSVSENIIVPNNVGYKYCNSSGYHWEYFWGVSTDGENYNFKKLSKSGLDYWTNYKAACRTIAKKPSVAFWNGGVFTQGGIITSLASRSTAADGALSPTLTGGYNLFGSWTEYLAIANKQISGFTSGSALSAGNADKGDILPYYSTLTIMNNTSALGHANIAENNALSTRLKNYLGTSAAERDHVTIINSSGSITGNIEYNGTYSSIYQIPRTIIYVDGDVYISPNVTRIDAWIISTGTVHTCKELNSRTETKGYKYTGSDMTCDKQLIINGPVIAKNIELNRTFGADPHRAYTNTTSDGKYESEFYTPAEVFNLSAENYLWAYAQAGRYRSSYTNAYARELPPRY